MTSPASTTAMPSPGTGFRLRLAPLRTRRGRVAVGAVAVLAVAAVGVGARALLSAPAAPKPPQPVMSVVTVPAKRITMEETLRVNGSLTPWEDLTVGSEASGLAITEVRVDEGDWVKSGQLLAKLDDALLQAQLKQTEAQIARARATLKLDDADVRRAQELLKTSAISVQAAEQRETTADAARADLALAEAQRAALLAQLAQTEIRAPADGLISQRTARLGRIVMSSDPLFREVRDGILELDAEIPDRLLDRCRPGQRVRITRAGGGDVIGTVRLVAPLVDKASRNGIAHVRFPRDESLRAGMFVTGELILDDSDTLAVPESAVLVKDGRPLVFVVRDGGQAALRPIVAGQHSDGKVAVGSGLAEGDMVVTRGAGFLHDGDLVTVAGN